jgi:hypothetical protein
MPELLATAADLRLKLKDPAGFDVDEAELLLRIASGEVRAATGQLFDLVEDDVIILNGSGTRTLLLPRTPVLEVTELLEAYNTADEVALEYSPASPHDVGFEWSASGILRRLPAGTLFSSRYRWYRAVVSHGWDVVPDEVGGIVLGLVARVWGNPEGMRTESMGRYSYTLAGADAGIGLFQAELDALAPYMLDERGGQAGTPVAGSGSA